MTNIFPFNTVNDLEEDSFIAGTNRVYRFLITNPAGDAVDLSSCDCFWKMSPFGSSASVLSASAVVSGTPINEMVVTLYSNDTKDLSGKFIHQAIIIDVTNQEFRPSQGIITIFPRIK